MRMPSAAVSFNTDLEALISDPNRSIATLAITTLLKVGNESSVDRLLKQISNFMNEITDEFKVVVVESIRNLVTNCQKNIYQSMLTFLSTLLRDNDGYKFKKVVVSAIESIIKDIPEAKSAVLIHLCEFIEDCEHTKLTHGIGAWLSTLNLDLENMNTISFYGAKNRALLSAEEIQTANQHRQCRVCGW